MRMQKRLVQGGHGWTVLPGVGIADDIASGALSGAPLCDPDVRRSIVLGTPRGVRTSPAVDAVVRELVRQIRAAIAAQRWPSARPYTTASADDE
jgi:DNA-binding transcriptional LysR family regulator